MSIARTAGLAGCSIAQVKTGDRDPPRQGSRDIDGDGHNVGRSADAVARAIDAIGVMPGSGCLSDDDGRVRRGW